MIRTLVADHDKVGLQGVGTFVAEMMPASFSEKGYTINPPYRRLSFVPQGSDDGLLAQLYAQTNSVAPELASEILSQFLSELHQVLKDSKTIILPGLGRLRATRENNLFFVADPELDIFPDGYALEPISLRSHSSAEAATQIDFNFTPPASKVRIEENAYPSAEASEQERGAEPLAETVEAQETTQTQEQGAEPLGLKEEAGAEQPAVISTEEAAEAQKTTETQEQGAEPSEEAAEAPGEETEYRLEFVRPAAAEPALECEVQDSQDAPEAAEPSLEAESAPEAAEPEEAELEKAESEEAPLEAGETDHIEEGAHSTQAEPAEESEPEEEGAPSPSDEAPIETLETEAELPETELEQEAEYPIAEQQKPEPAQLRAARRLFRWWVPTTIVLLIAVLALLVFITLAQVDPDFIDTLLYTPEELRILNY